MILLAVRLKIARDDSRRHIRTRANRGVADVAEVVHLHIITQRRVFYLGKITDMRAGANLRAGPQPTHRADTRAAVHARAFEPRAMDPAIVGDDAIVNDAVGA